MKLNLDYTSERTQRVITCVSLVLIEFIQCLAAELHIYMHGKYCWMAMVNLIVTLFMFFYNKRYFTKIQSLAVANFILSFLMSDIACRYHVYSWIKQTLVIMIPTVAIGLVILDLYTSRYNQYIHIMCSFSLFTIFFKHASAQHHIFLYILLAIYGIVIGIIAIKKLSFAVYISRICNFYQIIAFTLEMVLNTMGETADMRSNPIVPGLYYAHILFFLSITLLSFKKIPRVYTKAKANGPMVSEDHSRQSLIDNNVVTEIK